ncbi:hypothetical protein MRX96_001150 [Rhipicephalus microplus]
MAEQGPVGGDGEPVWALPPCAADNGAVLSGAASRRTSAGPVGAIDRHAASPPAALKSTAAPPLRAFCRRRHHILSTSSSFVAILAGDGCGGP